MRILVISDTHNLYSALESVVMRNLHADAFIHLGDCAADVEHLLQEHPELESKFHYVRGNCDVDKTNVPEAIVVEASDGHRIFATHGHHHWVYFDRLELAKAAKEQHCDIAVYGHTHMRNETFLEGVHIMNPGSASQPRDGKPASYGWIDTSKAGVMFNIVAVNPEQTPRKQHWY